MARFQRVLIPLLAFASASVPLAAQEPAAQPSGAANSAKVEGERGKDQPGGKRKMSPEMQNVRRAIEALSPEQRKRFEENFHKWANLPPEEKKSLRDREEMRRKRMADDIEQALASSGLSLTEEQKAHFARRYAEERRKLEEELRREMNEKRKPGIENIVSQLSREFSCGGAKK
jgi:Spy/CpxP family protein refolding chaperone